MTEQETLWAIFTERLSELGGHVVSLSDQPWGACLLRRLDELGLPAANAFVDGDAEEVLDLRSTEEVWKADVGVTTVACAIAETGSVLLTAGAGRHRLASLAPPVHVALVRDDQMVATLEEALAVCPERSSVLVTGPSRTADIEGVLVCGVHGPRDVVIARLPSAGERS